MELASISSATVTPDKPMDVSNSHAPIPDQNQSLLEGLFQLAVNGDAGSEDFAAIDHEVHSRLLDTYQSAG